MKKLIALIAALMIMICGCTAAFAEQKTLTPEEAKKVVLDSMKLEEEQVIFTKVHLDRDDGRLIYEIEFIFEKVEYEFDVDARTDRIIESDRDYQDFDRDYDFDYDDWFDFD